MRIVYTSASLMLLALGARNAVAATAAEDCALLLDWSSDGANVASAEAAPESPSWPSHCRVTGTIDTTINFELLLPDDWNGKFLMGGGGMLVGSVQNTAQYGPMGTRPANDRMLAGLAYEETLAELPLSRGYATAGTDTGHTDLPFLAGWALNNPRAQEDHAYRAIHRTAEISKRLIAAYYASPASRSYFSGCSTGGRQALMSAQRFPEDFDGLIAGAPGLDFSGIAAWIIRGLQANAWPDSPVDQSVFTQDSVSLVTDSILAVCDARDGVADGVIDDPQTCKFDLDSLPVCEGDAGRECLTPDQLAATRAIFVDMPVANGLRPYPGLSPGSDLFFFLDPQAGLLTQLGPEYFRYIVFDNPEWDYTTYDISSWRDDATAADALMNATSLDLDAFRDRGAKLILWHGWSDQGLSAQNTVNYYEEVLARDPVADDYARLFMLPGVMHCGGGEGPSIVDWVGVLENWVERDEAPDRVLAVKPAGPPPGPMPVERERPICAYPEIARYDGTGDPDVAESYRCD